MLLGEAGGTGGGLHDVTATAALLQETFESSASNEYLSHSNTHHRH